jgi:sorbitol-specific phosphotransferase system component IIA
LTGILLRDPPGQTVGVAVEDVHTPIGGSAVHDQVFDVGIVLFQDGANGELQEISLIIGWYFDSNKGKVG